jgi:preprotein translocase subunit SecG
MFIFLTVLQALIAAALVGVILLQKSEGGGLGMGGSPTGLMSARGAADFLTRATAVLAVLFVLLSIVLAALAVRVSAGQSVDTSLVRSAPVDPLAGAAQNAPRVPAAADSSASNAALASSPVGTPADPLGGAAKK